MSIDPVDEFFDEFDEVANLVRYGSNQDFGRYLRRWFALIDQAPAGIPQLIAALQEAFPWQRVESEVAVGNPGMGPDRLNWPEDKLDRLGAQLSTFRHLANDGVEGWQFAHQYFFSRSNNIDDILHEMTEQLFDPFVAELRRHIRRHLAEMTVDYPSESSAGTESLVVKIDHTSSSVGELMRQLGELQTGVRVSNAFPTEHKARVLAELSAGTELLKADRVRVDAVQSVIVGALLFVKATAVSAPLERLADQIINAVRMIIGLPNPAR